MAQKLKFGNGTWATKEGSTLAYNDENNNYKPLPFTTTRNSIGTRVNKAGLIETVGNGIPRIDFKNNSNGALLLEPSRTNLITHSENFSQWNLIGITVTSNSVISPNGSLNASKLVATSGSSNKVIAQSISANTYTASVFAKKGEFEGLFIGTGTVGAFFNLNTHTFRANYTSAPTSYKIEEYGNGWYRYSVTFTISSSDNLYIGPNDNVSNTLTITGNGTNGIYTWGAQAEQGSYPTSYIPTSGSTVTRQADTANGAGNSEVFNDSEGVLFANISALANDSTLRKIQLNDNTANNNITIDYYTSSNSIRANLWNGSSQYSYVFTLTDVTLSTKVAFLYKSSEFKFYVNGIKVNESSSGSTFSSGTLKSLDLSTSNGSFPFYGKTKEIGYYDEILTDEELEYMTSYRSLNELVTELNLNEL